jgi:hypothetical protein
MLNLFSNVLHRVGLRDLLHRFSFKELKLLSEYSGKTGQRIESDDENVPTDLLDGQGETLILTLLDKSEEGLTNY